MEKRTLTTKNKYCISWISITIAYFLGFYMWYQTIPHGDYAGLAVGFWKDLEEIMLIPSTETVYTSTMKSDTRHTLIKGWEKAVKAAKAFSEE